MCTKILILIGAGLITAVGLAGIAISIYMFVQNTIWSTVIGNFKLSFAILFIIVSCLVTLTGAFGIFGACKNGKCLLHTFWILMAVWFAGFLAAGIVGVKLPQNILSQGCTSQKLSIFQNLDNTVNTAMASNFCKLGCPCYVANTTNAAASLVYGLIGIDPLDPTKVKNVGQCSSWTPSHYDSILAGLESSLQCSGWCSNILGGPYIFYFTNNNDASVYPTKNCFAAFSDFFVKYGREVYIASFIFAGLSLALVIVTITYICTTSDIQK